MFSVKNVTVFLILKIQADIFYRNIIYWKYKNEGFYHEKQISALRIKQLLSVSFEFFWLSCFCWPHFDCLHPHNISGNTEVLLWPPHKSGGYVGGKVQDFPDRQWIEGGYPLQYSAFSRTFTANLDRCGAGYQRHRGNKVDKQLLWPIIWRIFWLW